jgi:hypothetical protein
MDRLTQRVGRIFDSPSKAFAGGHPPTGYILRPKKSLDHPLIGITLDISLARGEKDLTTLQAGGS